MMSVEKSVSVNFSIKDVRKMLMEKTGMDEQLAKVIVGNLSNAPVGLEQVTKAILGIYPSVKYDVGDFVYVPVKNLPSWKIDRAATLVLESCKNEAMMAQITDIDLYSSQPYWLACTAVLTDGKIGELTFTGSDRDIAGTPEDPAEILKIIEDMKRDLPF